MGRRAEEDFTAFKICGTDHGRQRKQRKRMPENRQRMADLWSWEWRKYGWCFTVVITHLHRWFRIIWASVDILRFYAMVSAGGVVLLIWMIPL